jgi:hydrogenase/urease accessory protein HupE
VSARLVFVLLLAFALLAGRSAAAHAIGLSQGEYRVAGADVAVALVFTTSEIAAALPDVDADEDGKIAPAELERAHGTLERRVVDATIVRADGVACSPRFVSSALEGDAIRLRASYACTHAPRVLAVECGFLERFSEGHRHLATAVATGGESSYVLVRAHPSFEAKLGEPGGASTFAPMVWTGMVHIWTGYDHVAFLLGLLLAGGSMRALLGVISAFTVAHSMTLALAALHVVTVSPALVEPAIALSIVYVGIENLVVRQPSRRWRITFAFGLIHGFGFAGALTELDLPPSRIPLALVSFNLGVEIGQLAVVLAIRPLLRWADRSPAFRRWGVRALSAALAVAGAVWFVWRVAG